MSHREEILTEVLKTQTMFFIETLKYIDYLNEAEQPDKMREVIERAFVIVKENYEEQKQRK